MHPTALTAVAQVHMCQTVICCACCSLLCSTCRQLGSQWMLLLATSTYGIVKTCQFTCILQSQSVCYAMAILIDAQEVNPSWRDPGIGCRQLCG
jgi:hypothetical protein